MTRVFLAAGVAALAIAAPASAKPHPEENGVASQKAERPQRAQRQQMQTQRAERQAPRMERQQMRMERQTQRIERQQPRVERQAQRVERQQVRVERQAQRVERQTPRVERQAQRVERQAQRVDRIQQAENRKIDRAQVRADRIQQAENRALDRRVVRNERIEGRFANNGVGYGVGGCPPGLVNKDCTPPGLARQNLDVLRRADVRTFEASRIRALAPRTTILAPAQAVRFVGQPLNVVTNSVPLIAVPQQISYLYPDTPDYYYRYGNGYLYQVDRGSNLIAALLPLLAGGYMPGSYLPTSYMNSYAPSYYGLNSFYPSSYNGYDYGYGYDNLCNRYANGVIYRVDCYTGMIVDVVPMYAGGYGVGQMLPSAYSYYNVPTQYRSLYYDTPDNGYWYAPGAIYQYDQGTNLITSVAALMTPGFAVGQPLPMGYSTYNVPYAYRTTYYDTPDAWYRYNNGYIYRVDPVTQVVSAVVASILT